MKRKRLADVLGVPETPQSRLEFLKWLRDKALQRQERYSMKGKYGEARTEQTYIGILEREMAKVREGV